ncbi:MAG: hypothetical protein WCD76_16865 [Pyrinomonadaceae bacterium]
MKKHFLLVAVSLCLLCSPSSAQKRRPRVKTPTTKVAASSSEPSYKAGDVVQTSICKGMPIPAGFVTAGETTDGSCPKGAWMLKKKGTHLIPETPTETAPRSTVRRTPNRTPDRTEQVINQRADEVNREALLGNAVLAHKVIVGMTVEQLVESWGKPSSISRSTSSSFGHSETWRYDLLKGTAWIDINEGKVSAYRADW